MALSAEPSLILRGSDLLALPTVIVGDHVGPEPTEPEESARTEALVDEAYEAGYDAGLQASRSRIDPALATLDLAARRLEALEDETTRHALDQIVHLALELTAVLLQREVQASVDPGTEAIARTLALLPRSEALSFRLNPADLACMGEPDALLADRPHKLIADPSIASGDVVVDYASGTIDGRLGEALERIRQVMTS